jgi:hypothetical protein
MIHILSVYVHCIEVLYTERTEKMVDIQSWNSCSSCGDLFTAEIDLRGHWDFCSGKKFSSIEVLLIESMRRNLF